MSFLAGGVLGYKSPYDLPEYGDTFAEQVCLAQLQEHTYHGWSVLSTDMSVGQRVEEEANSFSAAAVNSPALIKPKHPRQQAVQSMI